MQSPHPSNRRPIKVAAEDPREGLAKSLEHDYKTLFDRLMRTEDEPLFAYCTQPTMDWKAILYRFFWQYSSVQPEPRPTWIFSYTSIINSYCLRCERKAARIEKLEIEPNDESSCPSFFSEWFEKSLANMFIHLSLFENIAS